MSVVHVEDPFRGDINRLRRIAEARGYLNSNGTRSNGNGAEVFCGDLDHLGQGYALATIHPKGVEAVEFHDAPCGCSAETVSHRYAEFDVELVEHETELAKSEENSKLRRLDIAQMVRELPPDVPWVVEGLVVEGMLTVLNGKEGEGKSLLAFAVAGGIAQGHSVAGMNCKQGSVVYVDAENGRYEIHRRVHTLGVPEHNVEVYEIGEFDLRNDLDELKAVLKQHKPILLVLDSFRSLWGGDENDSGQVARVLDPLRNTVHELNIGTILIHHSGRSNVAAYRGSSAIGASTELGFALAREPNDTQTDRRYMRCWKCRPAPEPNTRWLRLSAERGRVYVDEAEGPDAKPDSPPPAPKRAELCPQVTDLLSRHEEGLSGAAVAEQLGRDKTDSSIRRVLKELLAEGTVEREEGEAGQANIWRLADGVVIEGGPKGSEPSDNPSPDDLQTRLPEPDSPVVTEGLPEPPADKPGEADGRGCPTTPQCSCPHPGQRLSDGRCERCYGVHPEEEA